MEKSNDVNIDIDMRLINKYPILPFKRVNIID